MLKNRSRTQTSGMQEDFVMNTVNNVANFNGQRPVIDPGDAVLLLIDHQSGLFQTVKDMEMTVLRANATTLATHESRWQTERRRELSFVRRT
jgi:hypothetical protein